MLERDELSHAYGPEFSAIYSRRWDLWARKTWPFLTGLERVGSEGAWLDMCCGSGMLLKLIARRGYRAYGVDISESQVSHAREKAPDADLSVGDIREMSIDATFDVITCLFDSINYLVTLEDVGSALCGAVRHMKDSGVLVFDVKTDEAFRTEEGRVFRDQNHVVVFESTYSEATRLHTFDVTGFVREGDRYARFDECHLQRGYSADEIEFELKTCGLRFDRYDGNTFGGWTPQSMRIVYVCTRSE